MFMSLVEHGDMSINSGLIYSDEEPQLTSNVTLDEFCPEIHWLFGVVVGTPGRWSAGSDWLSNSKWTAAGHFIFIHGIRIFHKTVHL